MVYYVLIMQTKWLTVDRNLIGWGRNSDNAGLTDPNGTINPPLNNGRAYFKTI